MVRIIVGAPVGAKMGFGCVKDGDENFDYGLGLHAFRGRGFRLLGTGRRRRLVAAGEKHAC